MKRRLALCFLIAIFIVSNVQLSNAFVERKFELQEVINQSTNIVFGTWTKVDQKRKRAILKIDENLKGKSRFDKIKINVAVGQRRGNQTSPEKFMKELKVGNPVIIFYEHPGNALNALGHTNGTWFQIKGNANKRDTNVWWNFTHIEIYMHRTFKGWTKDFQQLLLRILKPFEYANPNAVKVLAFAKYRAAREFKILSSFQKLSSKDVIYKSTKDQKLPDLDIADILWIGYRSITRAHTGEYLFDSEVEKRIKDFVMRGGIVILSGQDSDPNRPCKAGFLPVPIEGVEGQVGNGIRFVQNDNLFTTPESIKADQIRVDDAWAKPSNHYSVLARTPEGYIAIAKLNYGRGMYIVTAMQNRGAAHLETNAPLIKNLIYLAIKSIR